MCLCWLKTPCVSWGKRWPPSPPSIPTRPKKPSAHRRGIRASSGHLRPSGSDGPGPLVHEGSPIFASASGPIQPHGNILHHATWSAGDLAQGFRESDRIFEHTFTTTWVHQGYMEPYACVVAIDAAGRIQVWANNKVPYTLQTLADALGFSEDQIVVNPCGIGGDFGKSPAMNVPLAYFLSLRSGRPSK